MFCFTIAARLLFISAGRPIGGRPVYLTAVRRRGSLSGGRYSFHGTARSGSTSAKRQTNPPVTAIDWPRRKRNWSFAAINDRNEKEIDQLQLRLLPMKKEWAGCARNQMG
jgi:hypothetical protein